VWWKGRLPQRTASMKMDWNRETFSIVVGLAQGAASVMVYVYALRIKEAIPFS